MRILALTMRRTRRMVEMRMRVKTALGNMKGVSRSCVVGHSLQSSTTYGKVPCAKYRRISSATHQLWIQHIEGCTALKVLDPCQIQLSPAYLTLLSNCVLIIYQSNCQTPTNNPLKQPVPAHTHPLNSHPSPSSTPDADAATDPGHPSHTPAGSTPARTRPRS